MFCANCGTKQNEGEKFCPNCGTKFEEPLKVEVAKVEEVSKSEKSKPEDVVPVKKDDTVQIENQRTKEEKSVSVINEPTTTLEAESLSLVESLHTKGQVPEHKTIIVGETISKEEAKIEQIILENNKEDNLAQKENVKEVNTEAETNNLESNSKMQEPDNFIKNNINDNNSTYSTDATSNTIHSISLINETDEKSILSLAVKCELGLGVPVDIAKAEELYAKIEKRDILLKSIVPIDNIRKTGIVSDAYKIETLEIYDSKIINAEYRKQRRIKNEQEWQQKKQKEKEEQKKFEVIMKFKSNPIMRKEKGVIEFAYIVKRISLDLESLINAYNSKAEKNGYDKIIIDKQMKLIKGIYKEKDCTGKGFVKGLSSFFKNINLGVDFETILEECEKIKDVY